MVLLVLGVGVHAVSPMSPDVVCHHASDCPTASQFGFSDSFKNVPIPLSFLGISEVFHVNFSFFFLQMWALVTEKDVVTCSSKYM